MKGRTVWNKPKNRNPEIYKLLIQTGGEARWKTLKAHLDELHLGPTTLKQALDEMVKEQSITKEARLGTDGAEVWYKIPQTLDEVWINFQKNASLKNPNSLELLHKDIKEKASRLKGKEKSDYIQTQMQEVVKNARDSYISFMSIYLRGAKYGDIAQMNHAYDYVLSDVLVKETKSFQKILAEYPDFGLRAIYSYLLKDKTKLDELMQTEEERMKANIDNEQTASPK